MALRWATAITVPCGFTTVGPQSSDASAMKSPSAPITPPKEFVTQRDSSSPIGHVENRCKV